MLRHSTAHVMAQAVQELYPGTKITIGPAIENGFYYDFARNDPFTPEDFPAIEAKMREIVARNAAFVRQVMDRDEAIAFYKKAVGAKVGFDCTWNFPRPTAVTARVPEAARP